MALFARYRVSDFSKQHSHFFSLASDLAARDPYNTCDIIKTPYIAISGSEVFLDIKLLISEVAIY